MSKKLKWALILLAFLVVAGICLAIGFELAGWDVLAWFTTKWAYIVYFFVGAYLFMVASFVFYDYIMKK